MGKAVCFLGTWGGKNIPKPIAAILGDAISPRGSFDLHWQLNTFEAWWGTYINPGYMKLSNPRIAKAAFKARATEVCQCCLTGFLCRSHWGRRSRHTNLQKWDVLCLSFPSGWIGWQRFEMLYIILWAAWRWCADDVWQPMDEENMSTDSGKMSHPIKNQTIYQTRLTSTTAVASQQTRSNIYSYSSDVNV